LPAGLNAEELQQKYPNLFPVIVSASDLANTNGSPKVADSGKTRYGSATATLELNIA